MLKVHKLNKTIQSKQILYDLSFEVKRGEIAIFLGESGVGKSSLFRVLNNLDSYNTGNFSLDEKPFASFEGHQAIGMVFQHFNLFEHLSVEDNIILPLVKSQGKSLSEANRIADTLLKRYQLENKHKIKTQKLSGGQKQRLAIARTVALNPQIICLDEPTSALDPRLTKQVADYLTQLALDGHIVLLTTHDMSLPTQLDATLFLMQNGQITEKAFTKNYYANPSQFPLLQRFLSGC